MADDHDQKEGGVEQNEERSQRIPIPTSLFGFVPMFGYVCFACKHENGKPKWHPFQHKRRFKHHLCTCFDLSDSAFEEIDAKISKDIEFMVKQHRIHVNFIKNHQKKYLESVKQRRYCYECKKIVATDETCDCGVEPHLVECFVLKHYVKRSGSQNYTKGKPLNLFDDIYNEKLHLRYIGVYKLREEHSQFVRSEETCLQEENEYMQKINLKDKASSIDWTDDDKRSHCNFQTKTLAADSNLDELLTAAENALNENNEDSEEVIETLSKASNEMKAKKRQFHQELHSYNAALAWPKCEQFANYYYFNLIGNVFHCDIEKFCLHFHPVVFPPTNNELRAVVDLAPTFLNRLEKQMVLYTDSIRRAVLLESNFQDATRYRNLELPFTRLSNLKSESERMFVPKSTWSRMQIEVLLEKVLHYTAKVVQSRYRQQWEAFLELDENEQMSTMCKWILDFGSVCKRSEKKLSPTKKEENFYGALILAVSLDLEKFRSPHLLMNSNTPRVLKRNLESMLLILRLVALTAKNKDFIHSALPYCETLHYLSSSLYAIEEYQASTNKSSEVRVTETGERKVYTCSYYTKIQKTAVVEFVKQDFEDACQKIIDRSGEFIYEQISNIIGLADIEQTLSRAQIHFEEGDHFSVDETEETSFAYSNKNIAHTTLSETIKQHCDANNDALKNLVNIHNTCMFYLAQILYISYPSEPPSIKELCDFSLGKSSIFDRSRPSIAAVKNHPKFLQISLTSAHVHFLPKEICRLLCTTLVIRNAITSIFGKKMNPHDRHTLRHFYFVEIFFDAKIAKVSDKIMKHTLRKQLKETFQKEDLVLTHIKGAKKCFVREERLNNAKFHGMGNLSNGFEMFNHTSQTHAKSYSNSKVSAFGIKTNSELDKNLLREDEGMYAFYGLTLTDEIQPFLPVVNKTSFRNIRHNGANCTKLLSLLYQIFFDFTYQGKEETLDSVNEMLTGARSSLHIFACGSGKTALASIRNMDSLMQYLLRIEEVDLEANIKLLHRRVQKDYDERALNLVQQFRNEAPEDYKDPNWQHGITLLLVPTSSLRETQFAKFQGTNLLKIEYFQPKRFKEQLQRFREENKSPLAFPDILVCTYTMAALNILEVRRAVRCGYIKGIVFDEAHSIAHTFLKFHQNLEVLSLKNENVPIFAFSGTVSRLDEKLLKSLLFHQSLRKQQSKSVSDPTPAFKLNDGVYRSQSTIPDNLFHETVQMSPCEKGARLFLICKAIRQVKEEIGDVIIFLRTKELVQTMTALFVREFGPNSTVYITRQQEGDECNKEAAKKWTQEEECEFAICTTAGAVGIDNTTCNVSIHVETYFGVCNYLQSASRASRVSNESGHSFFFAKNETDFNEWDKYYTEDNDDKISILKSHNVEDPNLEHLSNEHLKNIMGPGKHEGCIKCQLAQYFDDSENPNPNCSHPNGRDHIFLKAYLRMKAFYFTRKIYIPTELNGSYKCHYCPLPSCTGCREDWFPDHNGLEKYFRIYCCLKIAKQYNWNCTIPQQFDKIKSLALSSVNFNSLTEDRGLRNEFFTQVGDFP
ncbi:predicted protein [Chaetoceros tenuissimus]|uniref:Uncharacterized protein n=1 Tax=Chaetoceros tenuissimus TaxID=426638 RepID=A0AAD3D3E8_9STRA|nr:predicted protein [Chaetoceros tenuissimus]